MILGQLAIVAASAGAGAPAVPGATILHNMFGPCMFPGDDSEPETWANGLASE